MSDVLNAVAGYKQAQIAREELARTGTDFREIKGNVEKTMSSLHPKRIALKVAQIFEDTPSTRTLRMVPVAGGLLPPFQAGQYINLFVNIDGVATARPYAISSAPSERAYYDLTVKRAENGYVSHYLLDRVESGQVLHSSGPMGSFHHNPLFHGSDLVFLAGGSGSAPARAMLYDILERHPSFRFHLIYVNSFVDDVIYAEELRKLARQHDNFKLTEIITRPPQGYRGLSGRPTLELFRELIGNVEAKMFYVCGPTPFNNACLTLLADMGVKRRRIRVEVNGPPKSPDSLADWPEGVKLDDEVTVTVSGKGEFRTRVGEPLLNALERNGYFQENACRSGECSLCRVKLLEGQVFNPEEARLRKSDRDFGWIYSCVAFPTKDIKIVL